MQGNLRDHKSKTKRRSKNDHQGRDFQCGCGKEYLSYPALYTHIKQKHAGVTPGGTTTSQHLPGRGRGRPRKTNADISHINERIDLGDQFKDDFDMDDGMSYSGLIGPSE